MGELEQFVGLVVVTAACLAHHRTGKRRHPTDTLIAPVLTVAGTNPDTNTRDLPAKTVTARIDPFLRVVLFLLTDAPKGASTSTNTPALRGCLSLGVRVRPSGNT